MEFTTTSFTTSSPLWDPTPFTLALFSQRRILSVLGPCCFYTLEISSWTSSSKMTTPAGSFLYLGSAFQVFISVLQIPLLKLRFKEMSGFCIDECSSYYRKLSF
ncbi:hypothetical protein FKM82_005751 [Ascaphus truei]